MSPAAKKKTSSKQSASQTTQIHIDGAARGNPGPAGIGVFLETASSKQEIALYLGQTTNNVAETLALVVALQEALKKKLKRVTVFSDSELLTRQVTGRYRVKDPELTRLHVLIQQLIPSFTHFSISHVPRTQNRVADRLANQAVDEGLRKKPSPKRRAKTPTPQDSSQSHFW